MITCSLLCHCYAYMKNGWFWRYLCCYLISISYTNPLKVTQCKKNLHKFLEHIALASLILQLKLLNRINYIMLIIFYFLSFILYSSRLVRLTYLLSIWYSVDHHDWIQRISYRQLIIHSILSIATYWCKSFHLITPNRNILRIDMQLYHQNGLQTKIKKMAMSI